MATAAQVAHGVMRVMLVQRVTRAIPAITGQAALVGREAPLVTPVRQVTQVIPAITVTAALVARVVRAVTAAVAAIFLVPAALAVIREEVPVIVQDSLWVETVVLVAVLLVELVVLVV